MEQSAGDHPIPIRSSLNSGRLGLLLGLAFLLRVSYGLSLPNALLLPDASSFDKIAWSVATGGHYAIDGHPTALRPPSYVLFLAAIYKLAGHDYRAARVAQAIMGVALVWILMGIAQELGWSSPVTWAVGWMSACYPFFIYYDSHLIADAYLTFWHAVALLTALRWIRQPSSIPRASLMGLSFAVLTLIKSIYVPLFVLLLVVEAYKSCRKVESFPWTSFVAAGVAFTIPLGLWAWRNNQQLGRYMLDSHGGRTIVETIVFHDQVKDGTFPIVWQNHPLHKAIESLPEDKREAAYFNATQTYIRDHPRLYIRQSLVRFKDLWRFYPRQDIEFREGTRLITCISLLTEPFLVITGFLFLVRSWRQWPLYYPFYATIILTTMVYALMTGQMRYRLPLMPILILFSAYGLFTPKNRPSHH